MGKRDYIRERAFRLFIESGFSDVSVNDIIGSLDITKGCFYYYYSSKDALIEEVFDYYIGSYFREMLKNITREENQPKERLFRFYIDLISYDSFIKEKLKEEAVEHEQFYYLLVEATRRFDYAVKERQKFFSQAKAVITSVLDDGKAKKTIKPDVDTELLAVRILTNNDSLMMLSLLFDGIKVKDAAKERFNEIWQDISAS